MANDNKSPPGYPVLTFPSPKTGDVLFYETVDTKVGPLSKTPEYGTAYPNKAKFPDHVLVYIAPVDEDGNRKYWYACDRQRQDDYNFEISYPYGGRRDAPRFTRTYFIKRAEYTALAEGGADPVFPTAILIGQEMKRIGVQELDSLYVLVQRLYDIIPAPAAFDGATDATLHTYGITVDYPYNDEAYPRITWRIPVKHTTYAPTADLAACTVAGFTDLVLIEQEYKQNEQAAELGVWTRVYEKLPSRKNKTIDDDADWGQVSKFNYRAAEGACPAIGATFTDNAAATYKVVRAQQTPANGSVIAVAVVALPDAASQTGTLKRSKVTDGDWGSIDKYEQWGLASRSLPAIGSASPIGSGTVLTAQLLDNDGTYANLVVTTLSSDTGTQKEGSEIDKIFCIAQTVTQKVPSSTDMTAFYRGAAYLGKYVLDAKLVDEDGTNATLTLTLTNENSVSFTEYQLDNETGLIFPVTSNYTIGTTIPTGMDMNTSAVYRETKRLDCNFWVATTSKTTTLTSESYEVVVPGKWPAVLEDFSTTPLYLNSGVVERYLVDYNLKKAYFGACNGLYTREWSKNAPSVTATQTMIPEGIYFDGIFLNVRIPESLHIAITITETTGTSHPTYAYLVNTKSYDATNYTTWPASYVADCNIERYRGGFIKETLLVYAPS